MRRLLFVDRDGTLIAEPADEQVDALDKLELLPEVIPALLALKAHGYELVLVSNQDGLGTDAFPEEDFRRPHEFLVSLLASQGVTFVEQFVCPHLPADDCGCRKPRTGLVDEFLARTAVDRSASFVIGDRETDLAFARNIGLTGLRVGAGGESWGAIARRLTRDSRTARVRRETSETRIDVSVSLDEDAAPQVASGIAFFDHMLEQLALHGGFALELACEGDLEVDDHHTVEDVALALGEALRKALGSKRGIGRYGFVLPMDESLARVALDISGRPHCSFEGRFDRPAIGGLATEMVPHFFRSLAQSLGASLHVEVDGENTHHKVEAVFKAVGRSLRAALAREGTVLPSTKGVL